MKILLIAAGLVAMMAAPALAESSYFHYGTHATPDFSAVNAYEESLASRATATADWGDGPAPGTFRVQDGALVGLERSHGRP